MIAEKQMTTEQIARRLIELCRKSDYETAQRELYAEDAVSIEPHAMPEFEKETRGLEAIIEKGRKFTSMVDELHVHEISEPLIAGNTIAFTLLMEATMQGKREKMEELCVYTVRDGKIVSEQFFV